MSVRYVGKNLNFGGKQLSSVLQKNKTPIYIYDLNFVRKQARLLKASLPKNALIQYAMKANSNIEILKTLRREGLGVDVVSGGELKLALKAGFKASDIVFSGVGKTVEEIELAIKKNIRSINVESFAELERILDLSTRLKKVARVSLRVNPNVNARTHKHITTGREFNKFGVSSFEMKSVLNLLRANRSRLHLVGVTFHVGSQIQSLAPYKTAFAKTKNWILELIEDGFPLEHFSVGGGMSIRYSKEAALNLKSFGDFVKRAFKGLAIRPMCEPGRVIVGEAGVLLAQVQYVKQTASKVFVILNTGMHHLMRPALYDSYHEIVPAFKREKFETYEFVGPICESTDVIGRSRKTSTLLPGDFVAILNAGAYGYVMANRYNLHSLPKEIII